MKILVTGSRGVLGHALQTIAQEYSEAEFIFSSSGSCDLTNIKQTCEYVQSLQPDAIMHLAAVSGGIKLSMDHPARLLRDNVLMTINILEAARICNVKKVLMTLSSGMYPPDAPLPLKETSLHDGPAHVSNYGYAYAKRLIEPAIKSYRYEYHMDVIGVVPNGIFGENDKYNENEATVLASLIERFCKNKDSTEPLLVWGDGQPFREFTYSKDMARAFMWCLINYSSDEIINVGTTEEHSVMDIAYMVADELGIDRKRIMFDTSKPSGVFRKSMDNSKFLKLSDFQFTPFKSALKQTVKSLQD